MRTAVLFVLLLASACPARAEPSNVASDEWHHRVLKVTVVRHDGGREFGSAVALSGDRMVTNCHVIRDAREITVEARAETWRASADMRDAYRDLCFLDVPGYGASPTPMIETGQTRVGLPVVAAGYSGGEFALSSGEVTGLYVCECDGGKVIRTSARFDRGASGGGLFDQQGRLVGILTFKAKSGGRFHFALPVGWLRHLAATEVQPVQTSRSFWEQPGKESAHFLAACDLSSKQDWRALNSLAADWTRQEPDNPEAWMALGRARLGTNRTEEAVEAFQQALMLESTHAEAQWELQKLEVELGRSLLNTGHM
jgi:serine protease Do